jgi:phosphate transport system permease protein
MRRFERLIEWALFACALLSIGTTAGIVVVLSVETIAFLREVPITEFLFGTEWTPPSPTRSSACCRSWPARCWSR